MSSELSGIFRNTKNNILRNRWLSVATVLVAIVVFTTASFFIMASFLAQMGVKVAETNAQIQIYFELDTEESEISEVRAKVEKIEGVDGIEYVSQEEALTLFTSYFPNDTDLTESVSADWLPASLEVRAKSIDELTEITEVVKEEQKVNPHIESVLYHEDIIAQLKSLSRIINIGAIVIIGIFSVITIILVVITIAFNIRAHNNEIEIMHLVGGSDAYIKTPFIIEGVFYTTLGSIVAATLLIVPWYLVMYYGQGSNIHFIITEIMKELSLGSLTTFNWQFVAAFYGVHILIGALIGLFSSLFSVASNLDLKER